MSRQLAFSSTISAMVMAVFALSVTIRAEAASLRSSTPIATAVSGG